MLFQPSGLLAFLDSSETVPQSAIDEQNLNERDNLKLAQDSVNKNKKGPQWQAIERQMKVVEKHLEVRIFPYLFKQYFATVFNHFYTYISNQ